MNIVTVLFTNKDYKTAGIVVLDFEDGTILRHADEGKEYERAYLLITAGDEAGFEKEPFWVGPSDWPVEDAIGHLQIRFVDLM